MNCCTLLDGILHEHEPWQFLTRNLS